MIDPADLENGPDVQADEDTYWAHEMADDPPIEEVTGMDIGTCGQCGSYGWLGYKCDRKGCEGEYL